MNKIEKLVSQFCPIGVPRRLLGDLAQVNTGSQLNRSSLSSFGTYPVMNGGISPSGYHEDFNTEGPVTVISQGGASAGFVTWMQGPLWAGAHCFVITPNQEYVSSRFLYHFLKHSEYEIQNMKSGAGIPGLNRGKLIRLECPMPPLQIQNEIVKILDAFTNLEASLEAELEARTIQFEYYRKSLLTQNENHVPFSNLEDIFEFQYGTGNTIPTSGGLFPVYGSNGVVGTHSEFNSEDAPVIGHIGAYAGIVNWAPGKHYVTYNGVICKIKQGQDARFGYHLLKSLNLRELANAGSQPFVSYDKLRKVRVQIPEFEIQVKIGTLLDDFESLVSDGIYGLPGELKTRRRQHHYYRSKLLTFKELVVA